MRIGIDADPIGRDGSGNETYLRGLLRGLDVARDATDELILFGSRPESLRSLGLSSAQVVGCRGGIVGEVTLGSQMTSANVDAVIAHYNLPLKLKAPAVTIVHDVAFLKLPDTFARRQRLRLRASVHRSVSRSGATVTVSEFSKSELLGCYPRLQPEDVVVAPNAADEDYFVRRDATDLVEIKKRYSLPDTFVLSVGNIQPRKNLARTSAAAVRCGVPLVVAGRRHGKRLADSPSDVRWLGYVPRADLAVLYQLCTVFCYVSLYEGFGLPVVEALASGAVVVTSSTSALPEVAGGTAVLADPVSVDSIEGSLVRALGDTQLRDRLRTLGPDRARAFSWRSSAERVLGTLRALVDG